MTSIYAAPCRYDGRHYCENCAPKPSPFCTYPGMEKSAAGETYWCMRIAGHPGNHSAFTFSINEPVTWD